MDKIIYTLKRPIGLSGADDATILDRLEIDGDPGCGDLAAVDTVEGDIHKTIALIAALTGIPYTTAKRLKPVDFRALNDIISPIVQGAMGNA